MLHVLLLETGSLSFLGETLNQFVDRLASEVDVPFEIVARGSTAPVVEATGLSLEARAQQLARKLSLTAPRPGLAACASGSWPSKIVSTYHAARSAYEASLEPMTLRPESLRASKVTLQTAQDTYLRLGGVAPSRLNEAFSVYGMIAPPRFAIKVRGMPERELLTLLARAASASFEEPRSELRLDLGLVAHRWLRIA